MYTTLIFLKILKAMFTVLDVQDVQVKQVWHLTFITPREKSYLTVVERTTKRKMEKMNAPTLDEALEGQQKAVVDKIVAND